MVCLGFPHFRGRRKGPRGDCRGNPTFCARSQRETRTIVVSWCVPREIRTIETKGRIVEITARTVHGRYLLRPSALVNELILGVVGRGQAMYDVELFAFVFLSNHLHLLMRARRTAAPRVGLSGSS